jgi:hypothetical protein
MYFSMYFTLHVSFRLRDRPDWNAATNLPVGGQPRDRALFKLRTAELMKNIIVACVTALISLLANPLSSVREFNGSVLLSRRRGVGCLDRRRLAGV